MGSDDELEVNESCVMSPFKYSVTEVTLVLLK